MQGIDCRKLLPNFRELGGYIGLNGKKVKHNIFFRSPALINLNSQEQLETFRKLGIKVICDFRATGERNTLPDPDFEGIIRHDISALVISGEEMDYNLPDFFGLPQEKLDQVLGSMSYCYKTMPFNNDAYKAMFIEIVNNNVPILFHCAAGKDRTGIAAALILILLGVKREDVIKDYMITNETANIAIEANMKKFNIKNDDEKAHQIFDALCKVKQEWIEDSISEILKQYCTFEEYFEKEYGITKDVREQLCERYLE